MSEEMAAPQTMNCTRCAVRCRVVAKPNPDVLGGLLWLCDRLGLALSTDSSGPLLQPTWKDRVKAGGYAETWEENVAIWQQRLAGLRQSIHYREPPDPCVMRQLELPLQPARRRRATT